MPLARLLEWRFRTADQTAHRSMPHMGELPPDFCLRQFLQKETAAGAFTWLSTQLRLPETGPAAPVELQSHCRGLQQSLREKGKCSVASWSPRASAHGAPSSQGPLAGSAPVRHAFAPSPADGSRASQPLTSLPGQAADLQEAQMPEHRCCRLSPGRALCLARPASSWLSLRQSPSAGCWPQAAPPCAPPRLASQPGFPGARAARLTGAPTSPPACSHPRPGGFGPPPRACAVGAGSPRRLRSAPHT